MSCERFGEQIIDHACGATLPPDAAVHLAGCAACRSMAAEYRHLLAGAEADLRTALALTPSAGFASRVAHRVRDAVDARAVSARWWLAAAAAAAVIIISIGLSLQRSQTIGTLTPPAARLERLERSDVHLAVETAPAAAAAASRHAAAAATVERRPRVSTARDRGNLRVLVSPDHARAVARLTELLEAGVLDGTNLPALRDLAAELVVAPLVIPELEVRELDTPPVPSPSTAQEAVMKK